MKFSLCFLGLFLYSIIRLESANALTTSYCSADQIALNSNGGQGVATNCRGTVGRLQPIKIGHYECPCSTLNVSLRMNGGSATAAYTQISPTGYLTAPTDGNFEIWVSHTCLNLNKISCRFRIDF